MMNPEEQFANIHAVLDKTATRQNEMAARQVYHDEAFERMDAEIKEVLETAKEHNVSIKALMVIAQSHQRRIEGLEDGKS